ncbi:MAG TPA: DNA polymerase III subunit delta [Chloroflexota bacterium]|nr:DNA polymerase III subunit delta [Chloroflexota bacterium]
MIYLLVDDLAGRARLAELRVGLGDPSTAELNTATFDGLRLDPAELQAACDAVPFLAGRRLVLVRGLLARSGGDPAGEAPGRGAGRLQPLIDYLERTPESTDLVFVEPEAPPASPFTRAVDTLAKSGRAEVVRESRLDAPAAVAWVRERAAALGDGIEPGVAEALVEAVGVDRRALLRELEKLILLADGRPVSDGEVRALVRPIDPDRLFELVDGIGGRNARLGLRAWRTLRRAGEDPHRLLAMVARQFRLLVQASELAGRGVPPPAAAAALGVPPRVGAGLLAQARRWPPGALEAVYARIVALDEASKTGGPELEPSLEALILELVAGR